MIINQKPDQLKVNVTAGPSARLPPLHVCSFCSAFAYVALLFCYWKVACVPRSSPRMPRMVS